LSLGTLFPPILGFSFFFPKWIRMSGLPLCPRQQWASFFSWVWERSLHPPVQNLILRLCPQELYCPFCSPHFNWVHQKELLSNLGLTVFVRHLVDLVKQFPIVYPGLATISSGRWPERGNISYNTILQLDIFCRKDWSHICSTFLFPKRPPRMAKQMQARYPDHGDLLLKAPRFPWGTRTWKTIWCPRAPKNVKGGSPMTEIKSPGGTIGDISHPEEISWCPISFPSTLLPSHLTPLTLPHRILTIPPPPTPHPVNSWRG
jgi:hypothetical protein